MALFRLPPLWAREERLKKSTMLIWLYSYFDNIAIRIHRPGSLVSFFPGRLESIDQEIDVKIPACVLIGRAHAGEILLSKRFRRRFEDEEKQRICAILSDEGGAHIKLKNHACTGSAHPVKTDFFPPFFALRVLLRFLFLSAMLQSEF